MSKFLAVVQLHAVNLSQHQERCRDRHCNVARSTGVLGSCWSCIQAYSLINPDALAPVQVLSSVQGGWCKDSDLLFWIILMAQVSCLIDVQKGILRSYLISLAYFSSKKSDWMTLCAGVQDAVTILEVWHDKQLDQAGCQKYLFL